ncbi:hypothetical protein CEXT_617621 [Caerostris extrusa]|uniref:Secreted protein n=1 Tax=Caerostris extrusa TaxID=172846 RepID=A0AAV4PUJ8_CAEEX|nr:hypothetical protein CEXT_617621 [Caerostris extrusa]
MGSGGGLFVASRVTCHTWVNRSQVCPWSLLEPPQTQPMPEPEAVSAAYQAHRVPCGRPSACHRVRNKMPLRLFLQCFQTGTTAADYEPHVHPSQLPPEVSKRATRHRVQKSS